MTNSYLNYPFSKFSFETFKDPFFIETNMYSYDFYYGWTLNI
jgi:hypothetical protein